MKILINLLIIGIFPFLLMDNSSETKAKIAGLGKETAAEPYCNTRFSFCVDYPDEILVRKKISDNEDGIDLYNESGDITVSAYGSYNVFNWSSQDIYDFNVESMLKETPDMEVISTAVTDEEYLATLHRKGNIIFQKGMRYADYYIILEIVVPEGKAQWLDVLKKGVVLTHHS